MTIEEWWAAYCLQFGPHQIARANCVEGEREFLQAGANQYGCNVAGFATKLILLYYAEREVTRDGKPE